MSLKAKSRDWLASPYVRPVILLSTGAGLSQALALLITPIITRLYSPSDYGKMALYGSIVAIAAAVAAGRYESAVCLPPENPPGEREAISLVRLAVSVAALTSLTCGVLVVALNLFGDVTVLADLGLWSYTIPVSIFIASTSAALIQYATRQRRYGAIARIAPLQRVASSGVMLLGGVLRLGLTGLMLASILAPFVGIGVLFRVYRHGVQTAKPAKATTRELINAARRYSDFLRIGTLFALLNALALNVQTIALAHFYEPSDVGQYALATAVLGLPVGVILGGVSQVYLRECAARAQDPRSATRLTIKTLSALLMVSVPLFAGVFLASKYLFGFVFGPEWTAVGIMAIAMIPLTWARFLTIPLTLSFNVFRRQGVLLAWQVVALGGTVTAVLLGGSHDFSVTSTIWLVSAITAPLYLLLIPMTLWIMRSPGQQAEDIPTNSSKPADPTHPPLDGT
jgi:O-antigen/teichoic acid export membrane protein